MQDPGCSSRTINWELVGDLFGSLFTTNMEYITMPTQLEQYKYCVKFITYLVALTPVSCVGSARNMTRLVRGRYDLPQYLDAQTELSRKLLVASITWAEE